MAVLKSSSLPIRSDVDVVQVRQVVRNLAVELKFGLVDQTKVVTAASELARNTLDHGGAAPSCWRRSRTAASRACA